MDTSGQIDIPWWRHQMETFSVLLAFGEGSPLVTGGFPSQRRVKRSFDVFFYVRLNNRLSKQSRWWWFETPWRSLWRHCNADLPIAEYPPHLDDFIEFFPLSWGHEKRFLRYCTSVRENHRSPVYFPLEDPVMQSFDIFLAINMNKLLINRVFGDLRRHDLCDVNGCTLSVLCQWLWYDKFYYLKNHNVGAFIFVLW